MLKFESNQKNTEKFLVLFRLNKNEKIFNEKINIY